MFPLFLRALVALGGLGGTFGVSATGHTARRKVCAAAANPFLCPLNQSYLDLPRPSEAAELDDDDDADDDEEDDEDEDDDDDDDDDRRFFDNALLSSCRFGGERDPTTGEACNPLVQHNSMCALGTTPPAHALA